MRKLFNLVRSRLRLLIRNEPEDDSRGPRYGSSVSYMPCRACGEASLVYDEEREATVRSCEAHCW